MLSDHASLTTVDVPRNVIDAVRAMRRPVVISHVVPDADALGAQFATIRALTSESCRPLAALPDESVSKRLTFMRDWASVPLASEADFKSADGFIVLDTAKKSRCNVGAERKATEWSAGRALVNIDHHTTNTRFGDVNWVVESAGSACEILHALLRALGAPICPVTAALLYAGIQTDTLGFSLPSTTVYGLTAAADLVACGANVGLLGEQLFRSQTPAEQALLRVIHANTKLAADGQLAYSFADYDEIRAAGCTAADIDDQINVPRSLGGVRLAMLFTEGRKGKTRINFRGADSVTVADLAAEFNGGGHQQAAGAILDCSVQEAIARVLPRAIEHLRQFSV